MPLSKPFLDSRSVARIALITLLLLSAFLAAKSFVAVHNVDEWTDDIREVFRLEWAKTGKRSESIERYITRIDAIQKEWTVIRYIGLVSCGLCVLGIISLSLKQKNSGQ
jgi:hypothetical protein